MNSLTDVGINGNQTDSYKPDIETRIDWNRSDILQMQIIRR